MRVTALARVGRNVGELEAAAGFYERALGFVAAGGVFEDSALAGVLGVERVRVLRMRLGDQEIELSECFPKGADYPAGVGGNDVRFQHIAIVTTDILAACAQVAGLGMAAISRGGPVRLPAASGGVWAFKFRDSEGRPLEFLQFPEAAGRKSAGYDHSAISVADVGRSMAFYGSLGLVVGGAQVNFGPEQDELDGLAEVSVDVVALHPARATPHVELLGYRTPKAVAAAGFGVGDIGADRLVFSVAGGGLRLSRDPDGHVILLDGR